MILDDIKYFLLEAFHAVTDLIITKIKREPVIVTGLVVSGLVWLSGQLDIVVSEAQIETIVVPFIGAIIARLFTVPANEVVDLADSEL